MPAHPPDARSEAEQYRTEIEKLFDEFETQVYRCIHRGLSAQDAEEIVSSAFLALIPHWAEVREHRSPIMYVLRTALNLHSDSRRRAFASGPQSPDDLDEDRYRRPEPGPDQLDLRTALTRLGPREEQMAVMRYWMDLDPDEIAQILGLHDGQVRKTLLNTRVKLAELLSTFSGTEIGDE